MNQSTQITGAGVRRTASVASVAALVVALIGAAASPAAAEDPNCPVGGEGNNIICGTVTNSDGTVAPNVVVALTATGVNVSAITGPDGVYYFEGLDSKPDYTVAVNIAGSQVTTTFIMPIDLSMGGVVKGVNFVVTSGSGLNGPCDFVTSGGFVMSDTNKKISFGAHGGCKHGEFWGHVNVVDHSTGYHINSDEITGFLAPFGVDNPTRDICGLASTNNNLDQPLVQFRVRLKDLGEPGSSDKWGIVLGDGAGAPYLVDPRLLSAAKPGGGNIQLHKPNPSTTAPSPYPSEDAMCGSAVFPNPVP